MNSPRIALVATLVLVLAAAGAAGAQDADKIYSGPAPSPFFMGLDVAASGSFGSLGLRSASYNGQGFHGRQRFYSPGASNTLPGQNAMSRVSGTVIVPVELMEFDVE